MDGDDDNENRIEREGQIYEWHRLPFGIRDGQTPTHNDTLNETHIQLTPNQHQGESRRELTERLVWVVALMTIEYHSDYTVEEKIRATEYTINAILGYYRGLQPDIRPISVTTYETRLRQLFESSLTEAYVTAFSWL